MLHHVGYEVEIDTSKYNTIPGSSTRRITVAWSVENVVVLAAGLRDYVECYQLDNPHWTFDDLGEFQVSDWLQCSDWCQRG